jgi:hypothetical protein
MNKLLLTVLVSSVMCSCTWVKPTPRSHSILLLTPPEVVNCVKKGVTGSKTLSKIMFVPRNKGKMFNELVMLAKNEAVIMEGDAVVPTGEIVDGAQNFIVYRCR